MRLQTIQIRHYRSIEEIKIEIPQEKPLVLFGPNNAGKSNILSAIDRIIGSRYPTYIEMLESDYFLRDKDRYPQSEICATFDQAIYYDKSNREYSNLVLTYGFGENPNENLIHNGYGTRIYISSEQRAQCQSYLIDAERNIQSAFNYSSKYSVLSKFTHNIHKALTAEHKEELSEAFNRIKSSFEKTPEFTHFFSLFSDSLKGAVKGFVHSLEVDFSAYDPNNYANSLRIFAKEGDQIRSFEEFGTGEQQILLMAFVKAYMEVFTGENFVLIIEEPEAHLHPLAQRWLKEYMVDMCKSGIQIILSTHSTEFIDAEYLDGLVRVYKEGGRTKIKQVSPDQLCEFCVSSGVPSKSVNPNNITAYYSTRVLQDQLRGMFAETIILVEGETEYFSIPIYLKRIGFSMAEHGVEIINCQGKTSLPLYWRLFRAFNYNCYVIFDCDQDEDKTSKIFKDIFAEDWITEESSYVVKYEYAYFGKDFETYLRNEIDNYERLEEYWGQLGIDSKPGKAKAIAQYAETIPNFIVDLGKSLVTLNLLG